MQFVFYIHSIGFSHDICLTFRNIIKNGQIIGEHFSRLEDGFFISKTSGPLNLWSRLDCCLLVISNPSNANNDNDSSKRTINYQIFLNKWVKYVIYKDRKKNTVDLGRALLSFLVPPFIFQILCVCVSLCIVFTLIFHFLYNI